MAHLFDEILMRGVKAGQLPAKTEEARKWYRDTAQEYKKLNEREIMREGGARLTTRLIPGRLYMYYYDPKYKNELPYYDRFPLVFPFAKTEGGFMGLNMHYLPLTYRAKLMDALYEVTNNNRYNETTKLKFSYDILNSSSKFRYFKPCVKHYLTDHVRSKYMQVEAQAWDLALFLPLERFQKATKNKVWADSKATIRG